MNTTPSVDSSSPFFAAVAGQKAINAQLSDAKKNSDKKNHRIKRFGLMLSDEVSKEEKANTVVLPPDIADLPQEQILEILLDDVHSTGDFLKDKPTTDNILAYKNAVGTFIKFVVDNTFTVTESISGGNILKRKKFTQIQIINQKLEHLTADVLLQQKTQLKLLEKIEEINGLLIDLLS